MTLSSILAVLGLHILGLFHISKQVWNWQFVKHSCNWFLLNILYKCSMLNCQKSTSTFTATFYHVKQFTITRAVTGWLWFKVDFNFTKMHCTIKGSVWCEMGLTGHKYKCLWFKFIFRTLMLLIPVCFNCFFHTLV